MSPHLRLLLRFSVSASIASQHEPLHAVPGCREGRTLQAPSDRLKTMFVATSCI